MTEAPAQCARCFRVVIGRRCQALHRLRYNGGGRLGRLHLGDVGILQENLQALYLGREAGYSVDELSKRLDGAGSRLDVAAGGIEAGIDVRMKALPKLEAGGIGLHGRILQPGLTQSRQVDGPS